MRAADYGGGECQEGRAWQHVILVVPCYEVPALFSVGENVAGEEGVSNVFDQEN